MNPEQLNINTQRLVIRNMALTDVNDFYTYRSNPEITKYQSFDAFSFEQAEAFINLHKDKIFGKPGEWVQYGIESAETRKIIGDCAIKLDEFDPRIAEIGITISHLHQKKGYAKETIAGIVSFLFGKQNLHRIVAIVDADNTASIRLLKNCSFRQEGHFIENIFFKENWGSEYQFAMLHREWLELNKNH